MGSTARLSNRETAAQACGEQGQQKGLKIHKKAVDGSGCRNLD